MPTREELAISNAGRQAIMNALAPRLARSWEICAWHLRRGGNSEWAAGIRRGGNKFHGARAAIDATGPTPQAAAEAVLEALGRIVSSYNA